MLTARSRPDKHVPDQAQIAAWLGLFIKEGQVAELRIPNAGRDGVVSGYFDDVGLMAKAAASLSGKAPAVYFTLNPVMPSLLARAANRVRDHAKATTADDHITKRRWLPIDFDALRPSEISSTDVEHEAAIERARKCRDWLSADGWPAPILADSGNGGHLLYLIDLANDQASETLIKRCLEALDLLFSDDVVAVDLTVSNAARIWKVYGTLACKGDDTLDRPHRLARIIESPNRLISAARDLLEALAAQAPKLEQPVRNGYSGSFDAEGWIRDHVPNVVSSGPWKDGGKKWLLNPCPWNDQHTNKSAFIVRWPDGTIGAGCHHNSCTGKDWHALRDLYEPGWREKKRDRPAKPSQPPRASPASKLAPSREDIAWKPFPVDELPQLARDYVVAASQAIGCDPSYVALPLLSGLSAAIGNSRRIVLKRTWTEAAAIWTATVGESGELKSPAAEAPLIPIMARQAEAIQRHKEAEKEYQALQLHYEAKVAEWRRQGRKSGADPPEPPERPVCPRFWCSDTTIEALGRRLLDAPRGLLVYREELSGWLRSFDCYRGGRGGDVAHWLSIHGVRSMVMDRKGGDKPTLFVPRAFASITGAIQPGILASALAREHFEDGLAARLLFAMPPRKQRRWTEYDIDPERQSALAALYDGLYNLDLRVNSSTGCPEPVLVPISDQARAIWVDFYNEHAAEHIKLAGDLAAAWSKLEGYAARLALVCFCCRHVTGEAEGGTVDERSMRSGIALSRWFSNETRRVYASLSETAEEREQYGLVDLIRNHGGSITVRQLMRASRRYRDKVELAEQALNGLVSSGLATSDTTQPGQHGGRPSCVWRLTQGGDGDKT